MPRKSSIVPTLLNTAVFILLETAAFMMLGRNSALQEIWLSKAAHTVMGTVWGGSESLKYYFSLAGQNEAMMEENFKLREELRRYQETGAVQPSQVRGTFTYIPASIVKISNNKQHNFIIIDKGSEDGVTDQCGIITERGVVGIIDAVSAHHSFALSFRNADISISARLGTEGAVGPLVWDGVGSDRAVLKEIPLQYKYSQGDTVYTSGFSSIFPPDIPLGVAGESKIINGATNEIQVALFQDFTAIRFVTVVRNNDREEMEGLLR